MNGRNIIALIAGSLAGYFGAKALNGDRAEDTAIKQETSNRRIAGATEKKATASERENVSLVRQWLEEDLDKDTGKEQRELAEFKQLLEENPAL